MARLRRKPFVSVPRAARALRGPPAGVFEKQQIAFSVLKYPGGEARGRGGSAPFLAKSRLNRLTFHFLTRKCSHRIRGNVLLARALLFYHLRLSGR
jgi:hypothetical protein